MSHSLNPYLLERLSRLINSFESELPKADRLLSQLFREERTGSRDRPWLRDRFYYYIRHRLTIHVLCRDTPERRAEATHFLYGDELPDWLNAARQSLEGLDGDEALRISLNYPDWLVSEARLSYRDQAESMLHWMNGRAPTTLRVNPLKMDRETVIKKLDRDGITALPLAYSPWGLEVSQQEQSLSATNLYKFGCFELQDESSQLVCLLADPRSPSLLDACAGGGGKTLTLGSLQPSTRITATDIREYKLKEIASRAHTAGVGVSLLSIPELEGHTFHTVLIDAPCSGSGVLRRNPEDRWRISEQDLEGIIDSQRQCLEQYSALVQPGGELIYITCSFIRRENEENISWFLERHPDFKLLDPRDRLQTRLGSLDLEPIIEGEFLRIQSGQSRDLFFGALLSRQA